jgi:hypothetical protein
MGNTTTLKLIRWCNIALHPSFLLDQREQLSYLHKLHPAHVLVANVEILFELLYSFGVLFMVEYDITL